MACYIRRMGLFYSWIWSPNENILSSRYSRIGTWQVYEIDSSRIFKVILIPAKANLIIMHNVAGERYATTHSRTLRLGLLKKRDEAIKRQELTQFNEETRLKLEKTLLTWTESLILSPMQMLTSSLPPKV